MFAVAMLAAQSDLLARHVDRPGRAALYTGSATAVEGIQAVTVGFRVGAYGRRQLKGGDDATNPAKGPTFGDQRLLQAKGAHSGRKGHVSRGPERQPAIGVIARVDVGGDSLSAMLREKTDQPAAHHVEEFGTVFSRSMADRLSRSEEHT